MHRVELKVYSGVEFSAVAVHVVPNAPCGVERATRDILSILSATVPNAPCGVERTRNLNTP